MAPSSPPNDDPNQTGTGSENSPDDVPNPNDTGNDPLNPYGDQPDTTSAPGSPAPGTQPQASTDTDTSVGPGPQSDPQSDPNTEDRLKECQENYDECDDDGCPKGCTRIVWPAPIWLNIRHGDSGETTGLYDRPPQYILVRRSVGPDDRDSSIASDYRSDNQAILGPIIQKARNDNIPSFEGRIHHKWPLFMGGPDIYDNLVFLTHVEHEAWHNSLYNQQNGSIRSDRPGTIYCIIN